MATWREIDRLRKDPQAFRAMASRLLALASEDFTEWESDFLETIARRTGVTEYTNRQSEKLLQIRDGTELISEWRGFSIKTLMQRCYEARLDLPEDDEQWLVELRQFNSTAIKRRHIGRLARCAAALGFIEEVTAA